MAVREVRSCDVYGTRKDVQSYQIVIERLNASEGEEALVSSYTIDLCPRALTRLLRFVDRGTRSTGGAGNQKGHGVS